MATPKKSKAKLNKNNTTGYVGVSKLKDGKYMATMTYSGRIHRSGVKRGKAADAAADHDKMAKEALAAGHVKRITLNFP